MWKCKWSYGSFKLYLYSVHSLSIVFPFLFTIRFKLITQYHALFPDECYDGQTKHGMLLFIYKLPTVKTSFRRVATDKFIFVDRTRRDRIDTSRFIARSIDRFRWFRVIGDCTVCSRPRCYGRFDSGFEINLHLMQSFRVVDSVVRWSRLNKLILID